MQMLFFFGFKYDVIGWYVVVFMEDGKCVCVVLME